MKTCEACFGDGSLAYQMAVTSLKSRGIPVTQENLDNNEIKSIGGICDVCGGTGEVSGPTA